MSYSHRRHVVWFGLVFLLSVPTALRAQDAAAEFKALPWQEGPVEVRLGNIASLSVPEGFQFVGRGGAGKFMELIENPSDGKELGVLLHSAEMWFVAFEFDEEGYVEDDDRSLDAELILSSIREGTEAANKVRRDRGWETMSIVGWQQPPFYDATSNNLTWAILGSAGAERVVNHSTRLLGRRGVMKANLVLSPEQVGDAVPVFNELLTGFAFNAGSRYSEFTRGDKVAQYGLAGLVTGGVGVALVKTGLLQKFWKLIAMGFVALAAAAKRLIASLSSGQQAEPRRPNV
ncbi:MAG: DUF2167 domain-containing protein [Deltaproteobacteria bacterium]|nr:DUF2167 domain-containing protein [Deltaproteobacteria bacterium]